MSAARWSCAVGPITLRFPNFAWRRRALAAHDLHRLMTGCPMTMRGEFQLAAWEFAAVRYPHWGATLFCAPLIRAGLISSPAAIWRSGRRSQSLYPALGRKWGAAAFACLIRPARRLGCCSSDSDCAAAPSRPMLRARGRGGRPSRLIR
ncbi:MAG: hypothetical protein QOD42_3719 [Sphingomonadales bacterium]|nr:hypothetical protein [Sphingomonadales bacterium]